MFGAVTEKEKRENEALKNCIQEAYGLSDEQLLAELEELEATLSDDEFVGAEERIYNKIKEREEERSSDSSEETTIASEISTSNSNPVPIRKIGKKKRWLVVGIAAALVVGAGVNTIGGNSYFLKQYEEQYGVVLDGGQNAIESGDLEEAYQEVERKLECDVLRMNYYPRGMVFNKVVILNNRATFEFYYDNKIIYYIQERQEKGLSIGIASDRSARNDIVYNAWISKNISIEDNTLDNGAKEYSAVFSDGDISYRLIGIMSKEEFEKIISNFVFK